MSTNRDPSPRFFGRQNVFRIVRLFGLALAGLALAACSRSVGVATTPAVTYAVSVSNASGVDLAVSFDDGAGPRALGLVRSGRTERFVIASPRSTSVTFSGVTPDGTTSAGPVEIQLIAGSTVPVTLR